MNLVPAYGRDYKSIKEVQKDWEGGKDFQIADISSPWNGAYTSIRDYKKGDTVTIRYAKLTKVTAFTVK